MVTQSPISASPIGRDARADVAKVVDAIRSIVQSLRISGRAAEHHLGISSAQLYILQELAEQPAQSINELAERTFTHQSSVSMVVSRFVDNGFVTRTASRSDGHRLSISLTPAGSALARKAPNAAQTRLVEGLRIMSRSELHALAGHLSMLTAAIDELTTAETEEPIIRPKIARRA